MIIFNKKHLHNDFAISLPSTLKETNSDKKLNSTQKEIDNKRKIYLTKSNKEFLKSIGFRLKK